MTVEFFVGSYNITTKGFGFDHKGNESFNFTLNSGTQF